MAINDFYPLIPNDPGDALPDPDLTYSVPSNCGVSTFQGDIHLNSCSGHTGSFIAQGDISALSLISNTIKASDGTTAIGISTSTGLVTIENDLVVLGDVNISGDVNIVIDVIDGGVF